MPEHAPRRIVSLQPSATVILDRLGQMNRVVACTRYCADVVPGAAQGRIIVADSWTAQAPEILAAKPDLVIAAVPYQEKAVSEILRAGARFLGLAPKTLEDIYKDITIIAGAVGAVECGEQVIGEMQREIEAVRQKMPGSGARPRVYCEEWGKPLIRSQAWVAELVEAAGGEFLGEPGAKTLARTVEAEDPDVMIAAWCGAGDRVPLEKVIRERGWGELKAVREGRVYCVSDELLNTPAPTLVAGLHALAAAIHPEVSQEAKGLRQMTEVRANPRAHRPRS